MSFETFIALRYLKKKKKSLFLSFLSFISLLGICISVFSFVTIHSVMNGFSYYLKDSLTGFDNHITIRESIGQHQMEDVLAWVKNQQDVDQVYSVIEFGGLIETLENSSVGAKVRGVKDEYFKDRSSLKVTYFDEEEGLTLSDKNLDRPGILVGEDLYLRLNLTPGYPERVRLVYPLGDVGPTGEIIPRIGEFRIVGMFSSGFYEFDTQYVFIDENWAHRLTGGKQQHQSLHVQLSSGHESLEFKEKLHHDFPALNIMTWEERNNHLFIALKLERIGMFLLLGIVIFISSFNVLALMSLLVLEKYRDMAVLASLGAYSHQMKSIFMRMGAWLGIMGTALGVCLGLGSVYYLNKFPLPLPSAYYLDVLPVKINWWVVLVLALMTPCFTILTSLWPALRASRINPNEVLRET